MSDLARPPGPRGLFGIRNIFDFSTGELDFLIRVAREYGDLAYMQMLGLDYYLLNHPDDIETVLVQHAKDVIKDRYTRDLSRGLGHGLVTSDGALWRHHRKLASRAFTPKRIHTYGDSMVAVAARGLQSWRDGMVVDLHSEMSRVTMDVVGEVLFGADVDADARIVGEAMEVINGFFAGSIEAYLRLPAWIPTPGNVRFSRAVQKIDRVLYRIIAQRRKARRDRDDLLSALLAARAGEKDGEKVGEKDGEKDSLSDSELRDECVTLFLAGHETTALALVHAMYLLARHPEVFARWRSELDDVLGDRDHRAPAASDRKKLVYTERVVKEAMRLYPPVWGLGREVANEFELRTYRLPRGAQIVVSQWVVHRDPRWFSDPETFDPDRFTPERARSLPRLAYFPFGAGPRICIGNHFAMMEAVLLLALIGQRFDFELTPGQTLEFKPAVTLRPKRGIHMRLRARRGRSTRRPAKAHDSAA